MKLFVFPGLMDQEVLAAGSGQLAYARTEKFSEIVRFCCQSTLELLDCSGGKLIPFTSTGTGAMHAAVSNFLNEEDRVLVINTGCFGKRWAEVALEYCEVDEFPVDFGADIDFESLADRLKLGVYRAVLIPHHETSSGALYDIKRVSDLAHECGSLLVVDAISSFLADSFSMKEMGVDIAVLSSHKGLCLPPGLGMLVVSEGVSESRGSNSYWDLKTNLASVERGQPLFSPPAQLYLQWEARLKSLSAGKAAQVLEEVAKKADYFRNLVGEERLAKVWNPSNCLTSLQVKMNGLKLTKELAREGWYVMPSCVERQIRVAHLGASTKKDHQSLYEMIRIIEQRELNSL